MPAIVTVTSAYYTTGSDPGSAWTNEALAWDSTITGTTGALMMCATKGVSNTAKNLLSSGNNLSTAAGDPITKVEIGYRGKIYNANQVVYLQPIFGGSSVGNAIMIDPVTTNWQTLYTDITTVAGAPATWTRQAIADLDVNLYGYSSAKTANASTLVIDAVLIKVTETGGITNSLNYYSVSVSDKITDDNFDNASLNSTWQVEIAANATYAETTSLKISYSSATGSSGEPSFYSTLSNSFISQPIPSGDFDIACCLSNFTTQAEEFAGYSGLLLKLPSTGYLLLGGQVSGLSSYASISMLYILSSAGVITGYGYDASTIGAANGLHLRLKRESSLLYCYKSTNGTTWAAHVFSTMFGSSNPLVVSTSSGRIGVIAYYYPYSCAGSPATPTSWGVSVKYIKDVSAAVTTTIGIYTSTAGMTKPLPVYVSNKQGYIRLEPTSAYAGDKGTRMRVQAEDGIIYTVCATTS